MPKFYLTSRRELYYFSDEIRCIWGDMAIDYFHTITLQYKQFSCMPGSILTTLQILTHSVFTVTKDRSPITIPILQLKKLRHREILIPFLRPLSW